jgi:hypothetical protein
MAKTDHSKSITKVNGVEGLPDFMQGETDLGTELLEQFIVPPRIKIVQKQSRAELLDLFGPGDVILTPTQAVIAQLPRDSKGRPVDGNDSTASFKLVPLFFYPEWCVWNPIELRGKEPMISYRTTDPTDPIVRKARDPQLRVEPHPTEKNAQIRYVEHLNFIVVLYDHPLEGEPAVLSFGRGEWASGSRFASLIKMRKAPMYGCVFQANTKFRPGQLGDWWGLDISNPADGQWVKDKDAYDSMHVLHERFVEHHAKSRLKADLSDEGEIDAVNTGANSEF